MAASAPQQGSSKPFRLACIAVVVWVCAAQARVARADQPAGWPELESACRTDTPYYVTACYDDLPSERPDAPIIVAFNGDGPYLRHTTLATETQVGSIWGLAYDSSRHAVYAAAYQKRQMRFGPGGPGAIYKVDLSSGAVDLFATVPNAGADHHDPAAFRNFDTRARQWAGRTSLGDIDINAEETELCAVNLDDRRIYCFALPDGRLLGSFAHGAATETWAEVARPFALKSWGGRLYHGVVRTAEDTRRRRELAAYVYSSQSDGSDMRLELEVPLTGRRGTITLGDYNLLLDWLAWDQLFWVKNRAADRYGVLLYPQPVLTDIEMAGADRMILGFSDLTLDAGLSARLGPDPSYAHIESVATGAGDTLLARLDGGRWIIDPSDEHFADSDLLMDESNLGGLAMAPSGREVVSTGVQMGRNRPAASVYVTRGAKWYNVDSGLRTRMEEVCSAPYLTYS